MLTQQQREYKKQYRLRNGGRLRAQERELAKRDHIKSSRAEWRKKNRERSATVGKKWLKENRERMRIYYADYGRRNRKRLRDYQAEYLKNNPHVAIRKSAARRMKIEATIKSGSAIADFIKMIRNSHRIGCYYCGKMVSGKKAHIDHMIPLAKGGSHRPDNLCASCPPCNLTKSAKSHIEWKPPGAQQLMPL